MVLHFSALHLKRLVMPNFSDPNFRTSSQDGRWLRGSSTTLTTEWPRPAAYGSSKGPPPRKFPPGGDGWASCQLKRLATIFARNRADIVGSSKQFEASRRPTVTCNSNKVSFRLTRSVIRRNPTSFEQFSIYFCKLFIEPLN